MQKFFADFSWVLQILARANSLVASLAPSLVVHMVKSLPAIQGTWVQSLGGEDPLEGGMAIDSSILAWRIPWIEEPGGVQSMGSQRVGHNWLTFTFSLNLV